MFFAYLLYLLVAIFLSKSKSSDDDVSVIVGFESKSELKKVTTSEADMSLALFILKKPELSDSFTDLTASKSSVFKVNCG
jgi:hypothetical protein